MEPYEEQETSKQRANRLAKNKRSAFDIQLEMAEQALEESKKIKEDEIAKRIADSMASHFAPAAKIAKPSPLGRKVRQFKGPKKSKSP